MKSPRRFTLIAACLLAAAGLAAAVCFWLTRPAPEGPAGPPWFAEVAEPSGLHFVHDPGPVGAYFMPQSMGSGAALFDYDGDGRLDVLLLQGGGPNSPSTNRLFHQEKDGRFTDVSTGSGLDFAGWCTGVAVGDVNNDGLPDVFITEYGGQRLFLNNGDGTFTDVTHDAGLDGVAWATSAAFLDCDRRGLLDLVVVNYVAYDSSTLCYDPAGRRDYCRPGQFPSFVTKLYRNLGRVESAGAKGPPRVRFEDVTDRAGLGKAPGAGLGVACVDFTGDGWPDIFVANDGQPNRLWVNQHDGTFKDEAVQRGLARDRMGQAPANMGVALGDVAGDGLFDVFVTHLTEETHTLWVQQPQGFFRDRTAESGLAARSRGTGFGTVLADFDDDGRLDAAVVNGRVYRGKAVGEDVVGPFWSQYAEYNQLFAGEGDGRFREVARANPAFCGTPGVCRGLACGDLDNDGGLDLLVTTVGGPVRLYHNIAPNRGHWLLVRAVDPDLHRDAYGAEVVVEAGGRRRLGWINPGYSYQCSNDPRAHFGLGALTAVDAIHVRWPDGTQERFTCDGVDRVITLEKRSGTPEERDKGPSS